MRASRSERLHRYALDHDLIGAVAGHREERAAENSSPQRELLRWVDAEVEQLELAGRSTDRHKRFSTPRDVVDDEHRSDDGPDDVNQELNKVGPNHSRHAAKIGVDDRHCGRPDH